MRRSEDAVSIKSRPHRDVRVAFPFIPPRLLDPLTFWAYPFKTHRWMHPETDVNPPAQLILTLQPALSADSLDPPLFSLTDGNIISF